MNNLIYIKIAYGFEIDKKIFYDYEEGFYGLVKEKCEKKGFKSKDLPLSIEYYGNYFKKNCLLILTKTLIQLSNFDEPTILKIYTMLVDSNDFKEFKDWCEKLDIPFKKQPKWLLVGYKT